MDRGHCVMQNVLINVAIGLLPVVVFLAVLIYLDSYKLVRLRSVLLTIVAGAVAAGVAYLGNGALLTVTGMELPPFSRYVAPLTEEILKAVLLAYLIRAHRVGFHVDAAILGFAVGTGFALVENVYYLNSMADASAGVWIVRGFGTAVMHGAATSIFAIIAKLLADRGGSSRVRHWIVALLPAVAIHSFYNHFFFSPVFSALIMIVFMPPLLAAVFQSSERALEGWLGTGMDRDVQMLELIHSGEFSGSNPGQYLQALTRSFSGPIVADMLCYLRLYLELAIRAKGELMLRESGFVTPIEPETQAKFEELKYLEGSIGKTGKLAMKPLLQASSRDLWQLNLLAQK